MPDIKRHYVYELREKIGTDSIVFYVGKGVGARVENHADAVRRKRAEGLTLDGKKEERIAQLLWNDTFGELEELIIGRFDTNEEAEAVESTLIDWIYGKANLTNINSGSGAAYIRKIGDPDRDNQLDDSRTWAQKNEQRVESLGLREAAEELRSNLQAYGMSNTTTPKLIRDQDYTFNWPVNGTDFYIEFSLNMSRDNVVLNARANNKKAASDLEKLAEAAGYHLSKKGYADVYAPLAEYKEGPIDLKEPIEGGVSRLSSYLRGVPRSNVEDIVRLVQDFRIRLNLAKITLDSQSRSISEVSSLVQDAIDIFKQRPEEKHEKRLS